jgi:hypothetical protein
MLDKPQSVVSRLEDPNYGRWTLQTLFDVARKLDRAVIIRFVDFPTFIRWSDDMSDEATLPSAYDAKEFDHLAQQEREGQTSQALEAFFESNKVGQATPPEKPKLVPEEPKRGAEIVDFIEAWRRPNQLRQDDQTRATAGLQRVVG